MKLDGQNGSGERVLGTEIGGRRRLSLGGWNGKEKVCLREGNPVDLDLRLEPVRMGRNIPDVYQRDSYL